jgi:LysR family carnitine catabolism transcriptional activator
MSPLARAPEVVELRSFCAAADLGSLGRAAVRMHVSQPALSKRLQSLEAVAGVRLLDRSSRGVTLTPSGRRLYEQARRLLEQADAIEAVIENLQRDRGPLLLAASHSAAAGFVGAVLATRGEDEPPVELVTANSPLVLQLVADGRVEIGVAPRRPGATPNPALREIELAGDEVVYAVPEHHPWWPRAEVGLDEFLRTPVVVRDPSSNARWTVEAELRKRKLPLPPLVAQAATPAGAMREARAREAPVLLSRRVLRGEPFAVLRIRGIDFPRVWEAILPAVGEPLPEVRALIERLRLAAAGGGS